MASCATNDFNKEQALKELNAQVVITTEFGKEAPKAVAEFTQYQQDAILSQLQNIEHLSDEQINEILSEAAKWDEGGIYRVALHTAVGAIGTGTIEGAVTTGSVAAAAPTIDKLSEQITEQLVKAGISEDTTQNATSLITSLAIATATQSVGVDTTSTVMVVNADAFNRQLHPDEIRFILDKDRVKRFADKYGLSIEEAEKELAIVATAYHDLQWAEAFEKDGDKLNVLHEDQDRAFDFLYYDEDVQNYWHNSTEANSGMKLFEDDLTDKVRGDSFKNLDELMRAAAHDQTVREYIKLIWVNKDPALATFEYNKGVTNAYNTANTNPIETTKLILDDFIDLIPNIIKSVQSSDIGPIDSVRGVKDYERLLQLQGNYYDYGYLKASQDIENSQKIWMTMPAAEVSALAAEKVLLGRNVGYDKLASTQENTVKIENNVNVDNPGLAVHAVREFTATKGNPVIHRAENINLGQTIDRDGLTRVDKIKELSDDQIANNLGLENRWQLSYHPTGYPAWKPGTEVVDRVLDKPEKMRMVIDKDQYDQLMGQGKKYENYTPEQRKQALGGWATQEPINSVADMRQRLAVTEDFKSNIAKDGTPNKFYVVEFEVQAGVGVREGIAGTMFDSKTGQVMPGGVKQINFAKENAYTDPDKFIIDLDSIKEIK